MIKYVRLEKVGQLPPTYLPFYDVPKIFAFVIMKGKITNEKKIMERNKIFLKNDPKNRKKDTQSERLEKEKKIDI